MAFGRRQPRQIANALCEPLWFGRRVLLDISGPAVEILDEAGEPISGYDDLRAAAAESALAGELVADGYLLPAPLRDTVGVVVNLVEASSRRVHTSMLKGDDPRASEVKSLLDALANARSDEHWNAAERAAEQLVTWITELEQHESRGDDDRDG